MLISPLPLTKAEECCRAHSQIYGGVEGSVCILCYKADGSMFWNNMHVLPGPEDSIFTVLLSFQASDLVQVTQTFQPNLAKS
jgi:hypothetical protein